MKLPYYGSKDEKNLHLTMQILPERPLNRFVDCCFGSGNVTRTIPGEMQGVKKVGIELDKGMYTLHSQIRDDVCSLINIMKNIENTEKEYLKYKSILEKYVDNLQDYESLDIAVAELMVLSFSINSMRGNWRDTEAYRKHTQEEKRHKAKKTMEGFESRFYEKIPIVLFDLNDCWQDLELINGNFMDYTHFWEEKGTLCYLDLPYELKKRGITNQERKKNAGYMQDMTQLEHEQFISEVCRKAKDDNLYADLMICTNYEVDEITDKLIVEPDDLYINLLKYGFRMVVIERKESSEIIRKNSKQDTKKRRLKAEVIFINYKDIIGSWDNFEYYDYSDIYRK